MNIHSDSLSSSDYKKWLTSLKSKFQQSQMKASIKVNSTLLEFYWELGCDIVEKQKDASWGSGFLKQLSADLMIEFPDVKGFSLNNLQYIIRWYKFYTYVDINVEQAVPHLNREKELFLIPWGQNIVIIS